MNPTPRNTQSVLAAYVVAPLVPWLVLAWHAMQPRAWAWDATLQARIYAWKIPALTIVLERLTWFSNTKIVVITIVGLLVVMLALKRYRLAIVFAAIGLLELGNQLIQELTHRMRPEPLIQAANDSFPSGHSYHALLFGGFLLALLLSRLHTPRAKWTVITAYVIVVAGFGFSRVYLGFHWPTDVLGGYLLSIPSLVAVLALDRRLRARKKELVAK